MKKCLLWNVQILKKVKQYQNSLTKVQALRYVKIILGVKWFKTEIRGFVLYECNEALVMDICKMEELFSMFCFSDLFSSVSYFVIIKGMCGLS